MSFVTRRVTEIYPLYNPWNCILFVDNLRSRDNSILVLKGISIHSVKTYLGMAV
jgi:hypothetical protein